MNKIPKKLRREPVVDVIWQIQFESKPETAVADHSTGATTTANDPSSGVRGIDALGWTQIEALETRLRLSSFAEDWDAPGMDAYDDV